MTMLLMMNVQLLHSSSLPRFQRKSSTGSRPEAPVTVTFLQAAAAAAAAAKARHVLKIKRRVE
jgi:hypothetical protein